ncbi:TPA: cyclic nucleotide-binding domain-containing protein [Legionella pneumophila]
MNKADLHNCVLFKGIDEKYIDDFLENCEEVELPEGEFLFHQNEIGDSMYIVEQGELQIILDQNSTDSDPQEEQVIGVLKSGALFGELCVFGQLKRAASIRALVDCRLLKIEGEDFRIRIYSKDLDALLICYNIAKLLSQRFITLLSLRPSLNM